MNFKFSTMIDTEIPLYSKEKGFGFVSHTSTLPGRSVGLNRLRMTEQGIIITETEETMNWYNENHYNYGGLVFRIDVPILGAYHISVTVPEGMDRSIVSVSGMNGRRLIDQVPWDAAHTLHKQNYARWESSTWHYDYVTGENYIEIEIEPDVMKEELNSKLSRTIGISEITLQEIGYKQKDEKELVTIFTLGDSTVKTYIYEEAIMSGWGQVFDDLFDLERANVVNYSMGGRSVFNMYHEGRFNEILMVAKRGDYLLLQSGHNDESTGEEKGPEARFGRGNTSESYVKWLKDIYLPALRSRGIIPIFVTPMTRVGKAESHRLTFAGFKYSDQPGIDFPGLMKQVAEEEDVVVLDLYEESMHYLTEIGGEATRAMFLSVEAGETPGKTNSGSYANGNPSGNVDGTHFKETLAKQWARIVATELVLKEVPVAQMLKQEVREAVRLGDWSIVFPEVAKDIVTGENAYYREQIECVLKHGLLEKDELGNFNPKRLIKQKEFAKALEKAWDLHENTLVGLLQSEEAELIREVMAEIIFKAYCIKFDKTREGYFYKPKYMTDYNGTNLSPEDPNYDSNLIGESAQYYPLVGWDALLDRDEISDQYYLSVKTVYELGLMRSEEGICRGKMINGRRFQPKQCVTREKAAKAIYFLRILAKDIKKENDKN